MLNVRIIEIYVPEIIFLVMLKFLSFQDWIYSSIVNTIKHKQCSNTHSDHNEANLFSVVSDGQSNWMLTSRFCHTNQRKEPFQMVWRGERFLGFTIHLSFRHHRFAVSECSSFVKDNCLDLSLSTVKV